MITSEQVAQIAGVSRATVSRTLNGSPGVSDEVRKRVHAAIISLGYEPDVAAQNLARQHSRMIALGLFSEEVELTLSLFGQTRHHFYMDMLKHIEREAIVAGYDLILPSQTSTVSAKGYIRSLQMRRVAGVIMVALLSTDTRIRGLLDSKIPSVFIDCPAQGDHATYVMSDHISGCYQATKYLLDLGHRRIAFLIGPPDELSGRLLGCRQALAHMGVKMDPGLLRPSEFNVQDAYETMLTLLQERRDFTAVVAGNDMMAIGILRALHKHGLAVPQDISVIGFDDVQLSQFAEPPLTTVRQDRIALAQGAVHSLIALIEGKDDVKPLILPTELVVRESTGPISPAF